MAAKVYALHTINGPDGQVVRGEELPASWDKEFVDEMVKGDYAQRGGKRPELLSPLRVVSVEMKG